MLESLGVLAVCISSWLLYERGDGWDSLFLVLFSLIQLIDDQSTKLFWKVSARVIIVSVTSVLAM